MEFVKIDKYLDHPKDIAYDMFLDEKNLRLLKKVVYFIIAFFIIYALVFVYSEDLPAGIIFPAIAINLTFLISILVKYKSLNLSNIRRFLFIFLGVQMVFITTGDFSNYFFKNYKIEKSNKQSVSTIKDSLNTSQINDSLKKSETSQNTNDSSGLANNNSQSDSVTKKSKKKNNNDVNITFGEQNGNEYFSDVILFLAILILIFRFTRNEYFLLYSVAISIPVLLDLTFYGTLDPANSIPNIFFAALFCLISVLSERKRYNKFSSEYDYSLKKNYETIRMKKELNSAREIQLSMLPKNQFVNDSVEIAGLSVPASEVGGDYYDYFVMDDNRIGLFICDVSGHGVASGLTLSGLRSSIHLIMEDTMDPKIIMEKLNRMLRKTQSKKMFVTAIFAMIDLNSGKCEFFNAGHLPPYKISGDTGEIFKFKKHNITLGATDNFLNSDESIVSFEFNKGDKIIFYTDGVNEAMNKFKKEFGFESIEKILNDNINSSVSDILEKLYNEVKLFTSDYEQKDDITILIIGRK